MRYTLQHSQAPAHLGPTKTALYRLLRSNSLDHIHVDIRNVDYAFSPSLFPVSPHEKIVSAFEQARDDILQLLSDTMDRGWRLVSVFQVGRTESTALPSVVVMVSPSTCADLCILREGIRVCLRLDPDEVHVEFLPGALRFLQGSGISLVREVDKGALPVMGSSIDASGDMNAGTLGGYAMLKHGNTNSKGFITTYDMVRRTNTNIGDTTDLDRLGLAPFDTPEDNIKIQFPSQMDFEESTRDARQSIQCLEHELDLCREKQSKREMTGARVPLHIINAIEDAEDMLNQRKELVMVLGNLPRNVGKVLCTSGRAVLG